MEAPTEGDRQANLPQEFAQTPVVLVTGAGRGIGRAIALRFASAGATVILGARSRSQIEESARACEAAGGRGIPVTMDVTDRASVDTALAEGLAQTGGRLDVLVNNAGVFAVVPFRELTFATWNRLFAANLDGVFHVTQAALPALERGQRAHVLNIASVAAREPFEGSSAYCATKYGLRGLTDVLRLEFEPLGIRVSCVYPDATDTTIFDDTPLELDRSTMDQPEDVAEVVFQAWMAPASADVADVEMPTSDS